MVMGRTMIRTLSLCLAFWCFGAVFGYYTALITSPRPAKVRYSYVDTTPPPCVFQPTRDLRHVCEWSRASADASESPPR
jgi:hypothetical protein